MSFIGGRRYQAVRAYTEDEDESGLSVASVLLHRALANGVVNERSALTDKDLRQALYSKVGDSKEILSECARGHEIRILNVCVPHYTSRVASLAIA